MRTCPDERACERRSTGGRGHGRSHYIAHRVVIEELGATENLFLMIRQMFLKSPSVAWTKKMKALGPWIQDAGVFSSINYQQTPARLLQSRPLETRHFQSKARTL